MAEIEAKNEPFGWSTASDFYGCEVDRLQSVEVTTQFLVELCDHVLRSMPLMSSDSAKPA
ncbi:MAG: hypothetical protein ACI8RE_002947 [Ilumatobacter sp.]